MSQNYHAVGCSVPRRESVQKVTGEALYTDDLNLPGQVYGKILRSPHPHARVLDIDTAAAKAIPGVLGVLTYQDVPGMLYNCSGTPPSPLVIKDERILTGEPKHVGDKIAAVAAVDEMTCEKALAAITVRYEILPHVLDIEDALGESAPLLHGHLFESNICRSQVVDAGDVTQGFAQAEHIFEGEYRTPAVQHVAMEPTGCICHYTRDGRLDIWSTSQTPHHDRRILADLTGLPENRIRIFKPMMGGGFGARQQLHHQPVGAFLSKLVRRPVKMIYDREEEMYASAVRHGSLIRIRMGVNGNRELTAFHAAVYLNTGAYITQGPIVMAAMSRKMQYRVPHFRFEGYCVYTNTPVAGAMRGYGNPQLNFARETLINEACAEMGWDPVEFRMRNHLQVGDTIPGAGYLVESCEIEECLAAATAKKDELAREMDDDCIRPDSKRAWGIAFASHGSGIADRDQGSAVVLVNDDGSVNLLVGAPDIGQGSDTILAQIVAEELGLAVEQVSTVSADTEHVPYDTGTFSSRQAYVTGNAALLAAKDAKEQLKERLAHIYNTDKENVKFENREYIITVSGSFHRLTFKEAARKASFGATGYVITGSANYKPHTSPPPFAVCMAEIVADIDTGQVKVPNVIMAVDAGLPLNPQIVEGQVDGGVSMGVGFALCENMGTDQKVKKPLESDLLYYKTLLTVDSPDIHVHLAQGYEPSGPFGAKSVGELPAVPVAAAIVHAVYNATGVWVRELPLTHTFSLKKLRAKE